MLETPKDLPPVTTGAKAETIVDIRHGENPKPSLQWTISR
jgi:hypothetical protein